MARITNWAIVVHKNDIGLNNKPIYENLDRYCADNFNPKTECFIVEHNNDIENGKPKEAHKHIALRFVYNQGKTFESMKKLFPNSHLEPAHDFTNAVLYLTHESINAKKDNKTLYDRSCVVNVFNSDIAKYYNTMTYEPFDWNNIMEYIYDRGFRTILDFGRAFGFKEISQKWSIIEKILKALQKEQRYDIKIIEKQQNKEINNGKDND